jgi:hypothetical protein
MAFTKHGSGSVIRDEDSRKEKDESIRTTGRHRADEDEEQGDRSEETED